MKSGLRTFLSSKGLRIGLGVASTIVMLLLVYLGDRSMQSLGGEGGTLQQLYLVQMCLKGQSQAIPDEYLAINVGYDRELVDIEDEFGMPMGNIDITHRGHLAQLLDSLHGLDYKAIILDVNLDSNYRTPKDSALVASITATPRIVVSTHADASSLVPEQKTAIADYATNMKDNNFTKYPYLVDGAESVALKAFRFADGKSHLAEGKPTLEQPAVYLMLPITATEAYDENADKTWYNLSTDILPVYDRKMLAALVRGRVIVVGDYCNQDIHNTYAGDLSGPVILINAMETLRTGGNRIKFLSAAIMAIVYLLLNLFFAFGKSLWDVIPWEMPRLLRVLTGMLSYTVVLLALAVLQFALFGEFHDSFLTALWLTGCYFVFEYLNKHFPTHPVGPKNNNTDD